MTRYLSLIEVLDLHQKILDLNTPAYAHPSYWAPFLVNNNWP